MPGLKIEQINTLRESPFLADILDENGSIKSTDKSKILSGHFGVVPGVINEEIARILAGFNMYTTLETDFKNTLKPGNTIGFQGGKEEPELYTTGKDPKTILTTTNVSGRDIKQHEFPSKYSYTDFDKSLLSYNLLQSADFELVSGSTIIDDGNFSGHYRIPENYPFLIENKLPFPFMKEVANQIISLSYSLTNNPEGVQSGSTILLSSSHITRTASIDPIIMPGGSLIIISGKAGIDPINPKRGLIAEYTAHSESYPLFHGKITGTRVPTRIFARG